MEASSVDDGDSARVTTCSSCNETVLTNASTVKASNARDRNNPPDSEGQVHSDEASAQVVAMRRELSILTRELDRWLSTLDWGRAEMILDALQDALRDRSRGGDAATDDFRQRISTALPSNVTDLLVAYCAKHGDAGMRKMMDLNWLRGRMDPVPEATSLRVSPLRPIAETSPVPSRRTDTLRRRPEGVHTSCCCIL